MRSGYTPHRIYDVAAAQFIDFETLAQRASAADVVYFGERHGHGPGHRMQLALLEGLARRGDATLSLEMFERDVAPLLNAYIAGEADVHALLAGARPWERYATDYHPLVAFARDRKWRALAANVPRSLANRIAREGVGVLEQLDASTRTHAAADIRCPDDDYRARFLAEMRRHPMGEAATPEAEVARDQRFYEAQCVKDETMAEAIAVALQTDAMRPIVHVTGAFHTDRGDGIPVRVLRRVAGISSLSLTVIPVPDLDAADPRSHRERADYLLFTLQPPP